MKSLLTHYQELKKWDYYNREEEDSVDKIIDWGNQESNQNFIENFLKISGKSIIQDTFEQINTSKLSEFERLDHINSVFFLGCLLYENTILNENINFYRPDDPKQERDEFYFIWFLTSLVHDFGYYIEKNIPSTIDNNNIDNFKSYLKGKENDFYDFLGKEFSTSDNIKVLLDNVPKYYRARLDGQIGRGKTPKIDHGIAAGLILYNTLMHIKEAKQKELKSIGIEDNFDRKNDLYWGDDLDEYYFIASISIAVHNMRRAKNGDSLSNIYHNNDMKDLILGEGKIQKISINDDPFLLLFSITDTIEPTKIFDCVDPAYALENILITFEHSNTIKICNKNGSGLDFSKLKSKVKGLDDWLDIVLSYPNENTISIKMNL